jgi:hypothetical protein
MAKPTLHLLSFGGDDERRDADELALEVEEGAAAIAVVDGGIGLDEAVLAHAVHRARAPEAADDPGGDGALELGKRVADRDDRLAQREGVGIADADGGQVPGPNLQHSYVGEGRIVPDDDRRPFRAVGEEHLSVSGRGRHAHS